MSDRTSRLKTRRGRGARCEYVFDKYTIDCIEKIKDLGFSSRKEAVKFAIHQMADRTERGEIKKKNEEGQF